MSEQSFDLSKFMPDCLNVEINARAPTKLMFPSIPQEIDRYKALLQQDPLDILGETKFGKPQKVPGITNGTPIQEFFRGANVLITGGTGFIGKVLTEKLLRSVPQIGHIYLLIREKRGKNFSERFDQLLENKIFSRLRTEVPHYRTKITAVNGDLSASGLGLSATDFQELVDQVNVVFHSAADVKFIEPLRVAIASNVLGSKWVLDFAKKMKCLKSYVHVSTAYSQCVRRVIDETVPTMSVHYKDVLDYIESHTDEELEEQSLRMLQGWPNTYTFSKALCESLILKEAAGLPVCIFRPSVVLGTYKEPVRGWTDNVYGPVGLIAGAAHGILHSYRLNDELSLDVVPVDYVANCIIAAAWETGITRETESIPVYNFTSSQANPICWRTLGKFSNDILRDSVIMGSAIWYPSFFFTESQAINDLAYVFLHRIPGIFFDKLAEMMGQKPRLSNIYKKIKSLEMDLEYFVFKVWEFKNDNVINMWKVMSDEDKEIFNFDLRDIDFKEFILVVSIGFKYYYLKEKLENELAARRKNTWLYWLHVSLKIVCGLAALKMMVVTSRALPI